MRRGGFIAIAALAVAITTGVLVSTSAARTDVSGNGCQLNSANGNIKHVIYIQFDNTHFKRDNANVASDLEQMPNLLNFIRSNGTMLANDHTALISHTATGILTSLTGVYPDRMGQPVSNSFRYFTPSGASRTAKAGSAGVGYTYPLRSYRRPGWIRTARGAPAIRSR